MKQTAHLGGNGYHSVAHKVKEVKVSSALCHLMPLHFYEKTYISICFFLTDRKPKKISDFTKKKKKRSEKHN